MLIGQFQYLTNGQEEMSRNFGDWVQSRLTTAGHDCPANSQGAGAELDVILVVGESQTRVQQTGVWTTSAKGLVSHHSGVRGSPVRETVPPV